MWVELRWLVFASHFDKWSGLDLPKLYDLVN